MKSKQPLATSAPMRLRKPHAETPQQPTIDRALLQRFPPDTENAYTHLFAEALTFKSDKERLWELHTATQQLLSLIDYLKLL